MRQIDDYVESLFEGYGKSNDVRELKEETRTHLIESVNELLTQGKTEDESVSLASQRFGDNNNLNGELESILHVRRTFARPLLRIALICLVLGALLSVIIRVSDVHHQRTQTAFEMQLFPVFENNDLKLSPSRVKEIANIAQQHQIAMKYVAVYYSKRPFDTNIRPQEDFLYSSTVHPNTRSLLGFAYADQWYVQVQYRIPLYINPVAQVIPIALVTCYWILFAVWASVNAHRRRRLNWVWIVAFSIFNFLAWILFRSTHQYRRVETA